MSKKVFWSASVMVAEQIVYVYERGDRDNALYIKFTSPNKSGRDRREVKKLSGSLTVRDSKGELDERSIRKVRQQAAHDFFAAITNTELAPSSAATPANLTLSAGFDLLFAPRSGYAVTELRKQEVRRARRRIERILGANTCWVDITASSAKKIYRTLIEECRKADPDAVKPGLRQISVTVDALYSTAAFLRDEELIPENACLRPAGWNQKLKQYWQTTVGGSALPKQPRHSEAEIQRLFSHLHDPRVDPRFGLAFDVGGELRIGQVLRAQRSQLDLPELLRDSEGRLPITRGVLAIEGRGKKKTSPIYLTADLRNAVEIALHGYLADYEALYRAGKINDYMLFPAKRLKNGRAIVVDRPKALGKDGALKMFHHLEQIAGVETIHGRGWYGVRRGATDVSNRLQKDERVLNAITGHSHSSMREKYQNQQLPEIYVEAAATRAKARGRDLANYK